MSAFSKGKMTDYGRKIGLYGTDKGHQGFLKNNASVVLRFPFKDCVLEGGMTKEDKSREERYLHQEIDAKDIDALFEPKVLTGFDYIGTPRAEQSRAEQSRAEQSLSPEQIEFFDESGELKQNLLIKGNNLLALHSLKPRLAGKIKLIYIDPPYNTGSDGFKYNDNFNHSSWLVFMKNRLEAAKDLLREDGIIFVQCDDNEQAYLKVLMDEVFGREQCVNVIVVPMSNLSGPKIEHAIQGRKFPKIKEYLLIYSKSPSYKLLIPKVKKNEWDKEYNMIIEDLTREKYTELNELIEKNDILGVNHLLSTLKLSSLSGHLKKENIDIKKEDEWKYDNAYRIIATKPNTALRKKALEKDYKQQLIALRNNRGDIKLVRSDFNRDTDTARIEIAFAEAYLSSFAGDIWEAFATTGGVAQEGGVQMNNGKKPEALLRRIVESSTHRDDIVLDYHLGSGTTAAVAHKMGRRWIGIEQMDYIEDITKTRLKKVIEGEQGGISKAVNWQGGGSFVALELKKYNQDYIDRINAAETLAELRVIFDEMVKNAFLQFWFDKQDFKEESDYGKLDLWERKEALIAVLDDNQLYLNVAEMNDAKYQVSEADKILTERFYGKVL